MSTSSVPDTDAPRSTIAALFADKPPVLVEVRFPGSATSPDWYLCEEAVELDAILERLGCGSEVHLNSVWDLKNPSGAIVLRR